MNRQIVYAGAIPQDTDLLLQNKNTMVGLGYALQAILGISTLVDGLACTPTIPAGLTVNVANGSIYSLQNVDGTAYGSVAADTTNQIVKQGIIQPTTNFSCPAPATTGQSIVYLIQAAYQDTDSGSTVLPYYNASNPAIAYNGPNNTGVSQNTVRQGVCLLSRKVGTAATTGTQTTPSPDAGFVGLYAVTVANGQTTITSGNIQTLNTAPFITTKLGQGGALASLGIGYGVGNDGSGNLRVLASALPLIFRATGVSAILSSAGTSITIAADEAILGTTLGGNATKVFSYSKVLNISSTGAGGMDTGSAPNNGFIAVYAISGTAGTSILAQNMATSGAGSPQYSGTNIPTGYSVSALLAILPTNGSGQMIAGLLRDREYFYQSRVLVLTTVTGVASLTSVSIASAVPSSAKSCSGFLDGSTSNATDQSLAVAADSSGTAIQEGGYSVTTINNYRPSCAFRQLPIITAQTIYWRSADTSASTTNLAISSYTF